MAAEPLPVPLPLASRGLKESTLRQQATAESANTTTFDTYPALPHYGYRRHVVTDWRELVEGDSIVLLRPENHGDSIPGTVDAVSADGSILWLVQKGRQDAACSTTSTDTKPCSMLLAPSACNTPSISATVVSG